MKGVGALKKLKVLYMSNNMIKDWGEFIKLQECTELKELSFVGENNLHLLGLFIGTLLQNWNKFGIIQLQSILQDILKRTCSSLEKQTAGLFWKSASPKCPNKN